MKRLLVTVSFVIAACKPTPPPSVPPPADAPPTGSKDTLGGKPTTEKPVATGPVDFSKAIKIDVAWDAPRSAVVAKIHLEPGFHAYGPGEETGKPLAMETTGEAWTVKDVQLPKGETKDLGEMGKSVVVTGDVEAVMVVQPKGDAKAPVAGTLKYQVCSDKSCDRPRSLPFSVTPS